MKTIIILLVAFLFSSFSETKVSFSQQDIATAQKNIGALFDYIDKSNLPHQDVVAIEKTLKETFELLGKGKIDSTTHK